MRIAFLLAVFLAASTPFARAAAPDHLPDAFALIQLEHKAEQADPRERSFLYTELAHIYTEIAGQQIASGELEEATATLKHVEHYGELIHAQLGRDSKRLKNSEMLLHETTHKLNELAHYVSAEDKATVQSALSRLNRVNEEMLAEVFAH